MNSTYHRSSPDISPRARAPDAHEHIVIVGDEFGGLTTALPRCKCQIGRTLIDRHNYHLFRPLLYQVATAGCRPPILPISTTKSGAIRAGPQKIEDAPYPGHILIVFERAETSFASAAWSLGSSGESRVLFGRLPQSGCRADRLALGLPHLRPGAVDYRTRPLRGCTASPPVNPTLCRNKTFPVRVYWTTMPVFRPKRINEKAFRWNRVLRFDIRWLQGCGRDQICRASRL